MTGFKVWFHVYPEALYSLRTGQPAFKKTVGTNFFDYLAAHPDEDVLFNEAMTNFGQENSPAVIQAYDFSGIHKIVDVGGSHGSLLLAILQAHPEMTGILFDLPLVVESARKKIAEADLAQRCEVVGGDFFVSLPAGGDAYLLRWIIHDWDDEHAVKILRNCRNAMNETARLLLVEAIIPHEDALHPGKVIDFDMLVGLGGKERTEEEYSALFEASGFRLNRIIPTASPLCVIEGVRK
ncbi:MAG: methyltransferase [Deltaproteobacteria bacterium]